MKRQDLTLTESLKPETVAEMLTRTAAHYPNSGHTEATLKIVAEDWFYTFKDKMTDRAFIEAISVARRKSRFFPSEKDILECAGISFISNCKECRYYKNATCPNLKREGFNPAACNSFVSMLEN